MLCVNVILLLLILMSRYVCDALSFVNHENVLFLAVRLFQRKGFSIAGMAVLRVAISIASLHTYHRSLWCHTQQ